MKVPSPGESISEVEIAAWLVNDGDYVEKDQPIAEVDSDKATLELPAEMAGVITLKVEEGDVVPVGDVCCIIDTDAKRPAGMAKSTEPTAPAPTPAPTPPSPAVIPAAKPPAQPAVVPVSEKSYAEGSPSPAAKKMMADKGISSGSITGSGRDGRVLKQDVISALAAGFDPSSASAQGGGT